MVDDGAGDVGIASSRRATRRLGGSPPGPRRQWRRADLSEGVEDRNPEVMAHVE